MLGEFIALDILRWKFEHLLGKSTPDNWPLNFHSLFSTLFRAHLFYQSFQHSRLIVYVAF